MENLKEKEIIDYQDNCQTIAKKILSSINK